MEFPGALRVHWTLQLEVRRQWLARATHSVQQALQESLLAELPAAPTLQEKATVISRVVQDSRQALREDAELLVRALTPSQVIPGEEEVEDVSADHQEGAGEVQLAEGEPAAKRARLVRREGLSGAAVPLVQEGDDEPASRGVRKLLLDLVQMENRVKHMQMRVECLPLG